MSKLITPRNLDEGWSVQIYGRDRRLICSLEPSHDRFFIVGLAIGLTFGILLAAALPQNEYSKSQHQSAVASQKQQKLLE
jgi:hypothetical protein